MIVLPVLLAAFAAFVNLAYLASHPNSFASEMVAYTLLGASSASVVKPTTRMAFGYISSLVSNYPTSLNLPSLVAGNQSFGVIPAVRTGSLPVGWRSAAPVFYDRDARIAVGWDLYGLPRLSATPFSRLLAPSGSTFLQQDLFRSGRHLVYDWVVGTYGPKHSGARQLDIPRNDTCLDHEQFLQARSTTDFVPEFTPAGLRAFGFEARFNLTLPDPLPFHWEKRWLTQRALGLRWYKIRKSNAQVTHLPTVMSAPSASRQAALAQNRSIESFKQRLDTLERLQRDDIERLTHSISQAESEIKSLRDSNIRLARANEDYAKRIEALEAYKSSL
ncbi:hypothetical protein RhiJN_08706 [Ceratobasidium sp. AG-Ba]|nr:hypothetical protein RhiJN_08706 [Ceratobasidium sp. AG-Ba]QRW09485.1 hypothetical protein RhiLY_08484 [Ceratobasidium sp. AG-Ba]